MKLQLHVIGEEQPLVLVGNGLTGALGWRAHAEQLAPARTVARAQPLSVQLGLERAPLPADYSVKMESRALGAALDDIGWTQPVDVVGWSYGGLIARCGLGDLFLQEMAAFQAAVAREDGGAERAVARSP